jgi:hypothetical protein
MTRNPRLRHFFLLKIGQAEVGKLLAPPCIGRITDARKEIFLKRSADATDCTKNKKFKPAVYETDAT